MDKELIKKHIKEKSVQEFTDKKYDTFLMEKYYRYAFIVKDVDLVKMVIA